MESVEMKDNYVEGGAGAGGTSVLAPTKVAMSLHNVAVSFNGRTAVRDATFDIAANRVTSLIGPSGSGKTTLLRALNRLHDLTSGAVVTGSITLDDVDIYKGGIPPTLL